MSGAQINDDRTQTQQTTDFVILNFHKKDEKIDLQNTFKIINSIDGVNDGDIITVRQLKQILQPINKYLKLLSETYEIMTQDGLQISYRPHHF